MIVLYGTLFLGTCNPVLCRSMLTIFGILTIFLSLITGLGIVYLVGFKKDQIHDVLPFLMLGIGIDDMFVVCNSLDQIPLNLSARERLEKAMQFAGPSITISSITNAMAFLSGAMSSLPALQSFCIACCSCVVMLYLTVITVFLPLVYWDTIRVEKKQKDCCGACVCSNDSILCCKSKFLTEQQIQFTEEVDKRTVAEGAGPASHSDSNNSDEKPI